MPPAHRHPPLAGGGVGLPGRTREIGAGPQEVREGGRLAYWPSRRGLDCGLE
jgi:hypothetical protein